MATSWRWATVTATSPLAVRLDGDTTALTVPLDSLVDPTCLTVGSRVRCELSDHSVVVHGSSSGAQVSVEGAIVAFAGATAPAGWLLCNGAAVSRTTYAALFAVVGTRYGSGNGTSTFNLPNLLGRVPVGMDGSTEFTTLGETGGEKTHTLTVAEMPAHRHGDANTSYLVSSATGTVKFPNSPVYWASATMAPPFAGDGQAHNNLQPYLTLNYIIKI